MSQAQSGDLESAVDWSSGFKVDWNQFHMKNQMLSRYGMHIELTCESGSEWGPWRAWLCVWLWCGWNVNTWYWCAFLIMWVYPDCIYIIYYLNVLLPPFVLLCMCSSEVQIIRHLNRNLRLRTVLCLFSCMSFESIIGVALICNTRDRAVFLFILCWISSFFLALNNFSNHWLLRLLCQLFSNFLLLMKWIVFNYIVQVWVV